ncbi:MULTISPECIES: hypothetical protein, partial [Bacillus cereus group]
MRKIIFFILPVFFFYSFSVSSRVYADGPSFTLLGSKGVSIENKGLVGGKYSLVLTVNDADDVVQFQLSELMLVSDCTFNIGRTKWSRPSQKENKFEINWDMNGTYAFYIFVNGKVKGYARFKLTGFPKDGLGGGTTQYTGDMAKYYELPPENFDPNDFADYDNKLDGVCTNEKLPDKPHGSGDIENPDDNNNGGNDGSGNGGNDGSTSELKKVNKSLDEMNDTLKKISDATNSNGQKLGEVLNELSKGNKSLDQINKSLDEIKESLKVTEDVANVEIPKADDIKKVDFDKHKPMEDKVFEDKETHFKDEGDMPEKLPDMPDVPDVKDWDGFKKEDDGKPDKEQTKDKEQVKDKENQKDDELKKDKDLKKDDDLPRDKELGKDDELSKPDMKKDDELSKPDMKKDDELSKPDMKKD